MLVLLSGIAWLSLLIWRRGIWIGYVIGIVVQTFALYLTAWVYLVRRRLGPPVISMEPVEIPVGGEVNMSWRQKFNAGAQVQKAEIRLVFEELAGTAGGKGSRIYGDETVVQELELAGRQFVVGDEMLLAGRMQVPATGMHSFKSEDNRLAWFFEGRIRIDGWKDEIIVFRKTLKVLPRMAR
jgi:hypothetical protein